MEILPLIGTIAASLCVVLLIVVLIQLNTIQNALIDVDDRAAKRQRSVEHGGTLERISGAQVNLLEQMRRLDLGLSALQRQGSRPTGATTHTAGTSAVAEPIAPPAAADRAPIVEHEYRRAASPETRSAGSPFRELAAAPRVEDRAPAGAEHRAAILGEYRKLIAQPRKTDINRWIDDHGGESCEATEDGGFRLLDRDSGGLLVLVKLDDRSGMVLPAGRLVVDFATNFANAIGLRSVTRQTFDLVEDGSGVLRLDEPALAEREDGTWKLIKSGRLAGLNPD